jgi:hypothetical protein
MFDRETESLWQSLTGQPVTGDLAFSGLQLDFLAVDFTTWEDWVTRHPETLVLSKDQDNFVNYRHPDDPNVAYADYFSSDDIWFPAYLNSDELEQKSRVYGIESGNIAIAYPLGTLSDAQVVNDQVGVLDVVVTFDEASSRVRSYDAGGRDFSRGPEPGQLLDDSGVLWFETESGLESDSSPGTLLERINGIESFWFGWFAFRPHSQIYTE